MASGEGQVIAVHSLDEWSQHFDKGVQTKKLVVVDFTATWCGPCRMIAPVFAELAAKMRDVIFLKVDVDELKDVVEEFQIEAMPTFLFFKDGKIVDKVVGARKEDLTLKVDTHFNALATA